MQPKLILTDKGSILFLDFCTVEKMPKWDMKKIVNFQYKLLNTEAKRCFATHDEDNDYFNMRIYIILIACVYIQQFNFIQ